MEGLNPAERELVSLGAALGSNCVPCIEYHVPQARKAGLSDRQIGEAIRLADQVRRVPARKVLDVALGKLSEPTAPAPAEPTVAATAEPATPDCAPATDGGGDQPCCA